MTETTMELEERIRLRDETIKVLLEERASMRAMIRDLIYKEESSLDEAAHVG